MPSDSEEMPRDPQQGPVQMTPITPQQMMKRMIWDVAPCEVATQVAANVGLNPASEDVDEMEHRASHARMQTITEVIGPLLQMMSGMAVKAALESTEIVHGEDGTADEESARFLHGLVYQATLGILAELQDAGVIRMSVVG